MNKLVELMDKEFPFANESRLRRREAKLLFINKSDPSRQQPEIGHYELKDIAELFDEGDVLVVNNSGTLPASFFAKHVRSRKPLEIRLVSSLSRDSSNPNEWNAFLFGSGSWREKTELRELPPKLRVGDLLILGDDLEAEIFEIDEKSNRLVKLRFNSSGNIWQKMYELGNPIQYSYLSHDLEIWDQQTIFSTVPISIEAPSASFQLRWDQYFALKDKGVEIVPITHAISLSNSGDEYFDSLLPFPERYWISESAARKLNSALAKGKNIVAAGTSVIRALESNGLLHNGTITATTEVTNLKIDQNFHRTIVNGLLTGMHLPDESHIQILLNFLDEEELLEAYDQAMNLGYLWHEYGDLTLIKN